MRDCPACAEAASNPHTGLYTHISGVGLPVEPEPWPEGVTKVRAKDLDGRTWEFARVDAQVRVREVEPR